MSGVIGRWTSDDIVITVPMDLRGMNVFVTFKQDDVVVLEKNDTQMTIEEKTVTVPLTQADSGRLKKGPLSFMIRAISQTGGSYISYPLYTEVLESYKQGVLEYAER